MKHSKILSFQLLCVFYSFILFATNLAASRSFNIRPSYQTLTITNKTSMPLTLELQASYAISNQSTSNNSNSNLYAQTASQSKEMDTKTFTLAPGGQNKFEYRLIKKTSKGSFLYQGGLDSLKIYSNNTLIASYTSTTDSNGLQYFPGNMQSGSSYNLINIYESPTTNLQSPLYLAYDKMELSLTQRNPIATQGEYNNLVGGYNRY